MSITRVIGLGNLFAGDDAGSCLGGVFGGVDGVAAAGRAATDESLGDILPEAAPGQRGRRRVVGRTVWR